MILRRWHWLAATCRRLGYAFGVELGVKCGENARYLLRHVPALELVGVDTWCAEGEYATWNHLAHERAAAELQREYADRLTFIKLPTVAAARLLQRPVDFVFIDADHSYDAVRADILAWAPKLRVGGMLAGHDIARPSVQRAVAELIPNYALAGVDNVWYHILEERKRAAD